MKINQNWQRINCFELFFSDARNKNEYNESHVVTAKKVPKVIFYIIFLRRFRLNLQNSSLCFTDVLRCHIFRPQRSFFNDFNATLLCTAYVGCVSKIKQLLRGWWILLNKINMFTCDGGIHCALCGRLRVWLQIDPSIYDQLEL